jgi:DNA-binding CsgD family transcriptional regulator
MSATLHEKRCLDVLHATSVKDFKHQFVDFAQNLGFDTVGVMVVTKHSPTLTEYQMLNNAPTAYLAEFHNRDHCRVDPVNNHCKRSSIPIVWDRQTYADCDAGTLWELQAPFGYRSGIAVAMHLARGMHFMFGANWSKDRCENVPHFKAIAEDVLNFAEYAQAAAFELSAPTQFDPGNTWSLTRSELEALRWTMDGMTSWEIGQKMALSDCDVTLRLQRAMSKLGCGSKYEAVLKGIKLGLIEGA